MLYGHCFLGKRNKLHVVNIKFNQTYRSYIMYGSIDVKRPKQANKYTEIKRQLEVAGALWGGRNGE